MQQRQSDDTKAVVGALSRGASRGHTWEVPHSNQAGGRGRRGELRAAGAHTLLAGRQCPLRHRKAKGTRCLFAPSCKETLAGAPRNRQALAWWQDEPGGAGGLRATSQDGLAPTMQSAE